MSAPTSHAIITRQQVGNITHVVVAGVIDETFSPAEMAADVQGYMVIDLGRVERISSFGVRRWNEFAARLPPGASAMYMVHAPPVVVDQLNMVDGFAGVSRVLSVLAPYRCATCGKDRLRLVDLQEEAGIVAQGQAPEHSCPVCNGPMEFSDPPAEFFDYAKHQQLGTVDAVVTRYLRATAPKQASELPAPLKIIQEDITYFTLPSALKPDLNVRRLTAGLEGRVAFDFAHVRLLDANAVPKLAQIIQTAAESAEVFLCRVPHFVLSALGMTGEALNATITTLWLPCECRNCGNKHQQKVPAASYLAQLRYREGGERPCVICGGTAQVEVFETLSGPLSAMRVSERPLDDVEALESRALSQYLFGSGSPEAQSQRAGSSDSSGTYNAPKLQIIRRIGEGGMAEVFLARQVGARGFEKYVVVKKVRSQFAQSPEFVEMLFAEARANARLTHPNIVQTFDVGMAEGAAYITMEYVRGPDLKRVIKELRARRTRLPLEHALRVVAEIAGALHYAHTYVDPAGNPHPMVHRDVSPHNVLVSLDGALKLSDFGIAKVQGEEVTRAGVIKGKISYLSPEAVTGRPLDGRNDVFALGVVLFELLTDVLPFRRDHEAATLNALVREPPPHPSALNPSVPADLADLVLRALVKDPAGRIPTAAVMREEIEALMLRHGWSSSPSLVAQFVSETLTGRLTDFEPNAVSVAGAPAPAEALASPAAVVTPEPAPAEVSHALTLPMVKATPLPPPATSNTPPPAPYVEPRTVSERPSWKPKHTPSEPIHASPPPVPSPRQFPPPPLPTPRPLGAAAGRKPSRPAPVPWEEDVPRGRSSFKDVLGARRGLLLGAAAGFLGSLVVATVLFGGSSAAVDHLQVGERLYVGGLRVDPTRVQLESGEPQVVATAAEGRLRRFGRVEGEGRIDLRTLAEAAPSGGSPGSLRVVSDPPNCSVQVGDRMVSGFTPLQTPIEAGKELQVTVFCSDLTPLSRWVMAVPGQDVELSAKIVE